MGVDESREITTDEDILRRHDLCQAIMCSNEAEVLAVGKMFEELGSLRLYWSSSQLHCPPPRGLMLIGSAVWRHIHST